MPRRNSRGHRKGAGPQKNWNGKPAGPGSGFKGYVAERGVSYLVYRPTLTIKVTSERL